MELIHYQQLIIQGMFHLNALSNFDCLWISTEHEQVHGFINHRLPTELSFETPEILLDIKALCLKEEQPRFCLVATSTALEFLYIPLNFENTFHGFVRIGPYLTNPLNAQDFSTFMHTNHIPLKEHLNLRHFYDSLPLISNQIDIHIGHIAMNLFGHTLPLTTYCSYAIEIKSKPTHTNNKSHEEDISTLEIRYTYEHKLSQAIATSDRTLLEEAVTYFSQGNFMKDRFPDNPLRSAKNLALVLNTILRHAAEAGGLHPYFLDKISTKYALLIEQETTRTALQALQDEMYEAYFQEVKDHAYKTSSPFINRVIQYILLHLEDELNLSTLARTFQTQPSNLANQFKKETGLTVSNFVNQRRIDHACYYLKYSDLSVHTIATIVGYTDINYFSRTFKKLKGMTSSIYRHS